MPNRVSARNLIAFQMVHLSSHVDIDDLITPICTPMETSN